MDSIINQYCLKAVPFNCIRPSKLNSFSPTDISELAKSLQSVGLIHALCVCDLRDGTYEILAGERRYRAIEYVQKNKDSSFYENVPCMIVDDELPDSLKQLVIELSNLEQRDFDKIKHRMQVVEIVQKAMKDSKLRRRQGIEVLAAYMQTSSRYADMYLSIAQNGNQDIKDMFVSGKIPAYLASNASHLDDDKQKEFIERVHSGEQPKAVIDNIYKTTRAVPTATVNSIALNDESVPVNQNAKRFEQPLDKPENIENPSNNIFATDISPSANSANTSQSTDEINVFPNSALEPQYTEAEIFEINNVDFDENGFDTYDENDENTSQFAYTPDVELSQSAELDTVGRLGTVHKARVNESNDDSESIEKLQNIVRRKLETIKQMTEILTDSDINFIDYVSDWVDEMRTLI